MFHPIPVGDGGGGGDAVKRDILVFSVVFGVRICSIGPHLPAGWGDAVKWNIVVFSVVSGCEHARLARTSQHRFGAGVFLVSAKKGAISYPRDFFQRRLKC